MDVTIRTPMTCVCVPSTCVQAHFLHTSELPSLTVMTGGDNNDCLGAVGMMPDGDMVKYT